MDSAEMPEMFLPKEMAALIVFMCGIGSFSGSNAEFTEQFNASTGADISAKGLKQMMNKWRYPLEEAGVRFRSYRRNGQRLMDISFSAVHGDSSDGNDASTGCGKSSVTCDPCVADER